MRKLGLIAIALATALLLALACGDKGSEFGRLGPSGSGSGGQGGTLTFVGGAGGECVIEGACGNEIHEIQFDAPNIYFVLDRSGSMQALEPSGDNRYQVVREAAIEMIGSLGTLINTGAAVFPHGDVQSFPCSAGDEVFPVTPGQPSGESESDMVQAFRAATNGQPFGGTPIAQSLFEIRDELEALSGKTIVMLLTDGGPNCNPSISCGEATCMPHLEGDCRPGEDCCNPANSIYGPLLCLDDGATVAEIQAIAGLGIELYVIGIPGSEFYGGVLDDMAVAAGTDLGGTYHRVDDLDTLGGVFGDIAAAAISCELPLGDPPQDVGFTNVYFDCEVVAYDPVQGWNWNDSQDTVQLNGASCLQLKSGQVSQVTIATGCPTEVPK